MELGRVIEIQHKLYLQNSLDTAVFRKGTVCIVFKSCLILENKKNHSLS